MEFSTRRLANIGLLLALIGHASCVAADQQYRRLGPFSTSSYNKPVQLALKSGKTLQTSVTLTFPTNAHGHSPLVVAFNGLQCQASWYIDTVTRITSWGYVVLQYDLNLISELANGDREEVTYLQPLLDWLSSEVAEGSGSPAAGLVDLSRKAVLGHSRGGKLAALQYASRGDIETAVLLDPVDCTAAASGPEYPSAVAALAGVEASCGGKPQPLIRSGRTAAVIGAGVVASSLCNPPQYNYAAFTNVLGPGTWKIVIKEAGHMQFPDSTDLAYKALDATCGKGSIDTQEVVSHAATVAVAWLETHFRKSEAEYGPRLQAFGDWLEEKMTDGTIAFETLVAERAGEPVFVRVA